MPSIKKKKRRIRRSISFVKNLNLFLFLSTISHHRSYTPIEISEIRSNSTIVSNTFPKSFLFPLPAYRSVGIYTSCSVARPGQRYIEFVGDWIRSEEVDFLVGGHPRPSHDPRQDHSLEATEWRRRSCKGIRLRIRNDKILTKRVSPSPPLPPLPLSLSVQYFSGIIFVHRTGTLTKRNERQKRRGKGRRRWLRGEEVLGNRGTIRGIRWLKTNLTGGRAVSL